jgi:two-component system, sporulation sensor kinase D
VDLYARKQRWKLLLAGLALLIVSASLWYSGLIVRQVRAEERRKVQLWAEAVRSRVELVNYTDSLFNTLRKEERKKVELWAEAMLKLVSTAEGDIAFYLRVVSENTTVPVIITDAQRRVKFKRNLDPWTEADSALLAQEVRAMEALHEPLRIDVYGGERQYLYYKDSRIFSDLQRTMDGIIRSFISETVMNTAAVPVLLTDSARTRVIESGNVDRAVVADPDALQARIARMAEQNAPIRVRVAGLGISYIYYEESLVLRQLRFFPYAQLLLIGLFLVVSYALFSLFRKAEQNQVWVGMAKETAHQLGTPISSLLAWTELLREQGAPASTLAELEKDLERLQVITERFSKIGAAPDLVVDDLHDVIEGSLNYLRPRVSQQVHIEFGTAASTALAALNRPLFGWVIENLVRNAVDAMDGKGRILFETAADGMSVHVDVTDTGKGIAASKHATVFDPGYTTKQRGWGLGLSLSKRIIETYHKGHIVVKRSAPGQGTTFRITLKRA